MVGLAKPAPARADPFVQLIFWGSLVIRILVTLIGTAWDEYSPRRRYSDVDYLVFTDASRELVERPGLVEPSPYHRATYRYTPLLAWLVLPSVFGPFSFGKFVFVAFDMLLGWLIQRMLTMRGLSPRAAAVYTATWFLNPFNINVSTRGNADTIVCCLVLLTVYLLMQRRDILAAVVFGLAVHVKIYPIVYALPLVLFINHEYAGQPLPTWPGVHPALQWLRQFFSWRRIRFGLVSGGVFFALLAALYAAYGFPFLYESYLYHFSRTDNRHNFSPYFYDLYLRFDMAESRRLVGLVSFVPQFAVVILLGIRYYADLPVALLLQTLAFVTFNKVCTAQYFMWWLALAPAAFPTIHASVRALAIVGAAWLGSEIWWLVSASALEEFGHATFPLVWLAGLAFFVCNVALLVLFASSARPVAVFRAGKVAQLGRRGTEGPDTAVGRVLAGVGKLFGPAHDAA